MDVLDQIAVRVPVRTGLGVLATLRLMNPVALASRIWKHRELILQLTQRDVAGRYRGSYLGFAWSFLTPVAMLTVYTLVFSVILRARWGLETESEIDFALVLFAGLVIYNVLAECTAQGPLSIVSHPQYVRRVVFPLEILPIVTFLSAATHAAVSFLILIVALWLRGSAPGPALLLLPIVLLPLLFLALGAGWFLAALGVFFRDIGQMVIPFNTAMMFLSPVFYPISTIPEWLRPLYALNPLTAVITDARNVLILEGSPDWMRFVTVSGLALLFALFGYAWFERTRRGFADVL